MKFDELRSYQKFHTRPFVCTEEEMVSFAEEWDPQFWHLDHEQAKTSLFKGLVASGFYTLCKAWKMFLTDNPFGTDFVGGLGINGIQWLLPVRPNDELSTTITVCDMQRRGGADTGMVVLNIDVKNGEGRDVLCANASILVRCYAVNLNDNVSH